MGQLSIIIPVYNGKIANNQTSWFNIVKLLKILGVVTLINDGSTDDRTKY